MRWQAVRRVGQSRRSFRELPRYGVNGMDVYMTYPYFDFPCYPDAEVRLMLRGEKAVPEDFYEYFATYNKRRLSAFLELFTGLDGIIGDAVEGAIGHSQNCDPQSLFREELDDELGARILGHTCKRLKKREKSIIRRCASARLISA